MYLTNSGPKSTFGKEINPSHQNQYDWPNLKTLKELADSISAIDKEISSQKSLIPCQTPHKEIRRLLKNILALQYGESSPASNSKYYSIINS